MPNDGYLFEPQPHRSFDPGRIAGWTKFAHKHGWITEGDGLIHTIGDVGIVYTRGADFIICIYMYHPVQLVWDPANVLMAQLGKAVYNYYNQFE